MGLTIKSVAAGGAVYKENQPQVNDVLYSINDDVCTEMTLTQARTLIRHHSLRSRLVNLGFISKADVERIKQRAKKEKIDSASKALQKSVTTIGSSGKVSSVGALSGRVLVLHKTGPSLGMTIVGGKHVRNKVLGPGIFVKEVKRDSPAEKAGVKLGDRIIKVSYSSDK